MAEWLRESQRHGVADLDIGVIAGDGGFGMGRVIAPDLPKPHDGVIVVEETRVPGMRDHVTLAVSHPAMLVSREVVQQVCAYLSRGRFVLGVGRGFFPRDFEAFHVDPARTHEMMAEWVDIIMQIWTKHTAQWSSDLIELPDVRPFPTPYTTPHPPLYTVGQSPTTIEWAASRGIPLIIPVTSAAETMRANLELTHGALFSQRVLLSLVELGMSRSDAYRIVQRLAHQAKPAVLEIAQPPMDQLG